MMMVIHDNKSRTHSDVNLRRRYQRPESVQYRARPRRSLLTADDGRIK